MLYPVPRVSPVGSRLAREAFERLSGEIASAHLLLAKAGALAKPVSLTGRLEARDGRLVLAVPAAVVRGLFDALSELGAELPKDESGRLCSYIEVTEPGEVEVDRCTERGHHYGWQLGRLMVEDGDEVSKVYSLDVSSPELNTIRKSYGLAARDLSLPIASRKKHILRENDVSKDAKLHPYHVALREASKDVHPDPTIGQIEAGNHRMGHLAWKGLDITIEVPDGSVRKKTGKGGKVWSRTMRGAHYGYIRGTEAADGDHVDIYFATDHPTSDVVFGCNQLKEDGSYDETKWVLGCVDEEQARNLYLAHYPKNWGRLGSIKAMTVEDFKTWLKTGDMTKPAEDQTFRLYRYNCPKCGGSNAYNGDPDIGCQFRGSGKCADCGGTFSIVGLNLKPIGEGPEIGGRLLKKAEERRGPEAEYCPHCDARLERDPYSGKCNRCGEIWPEKSSWDRLKPLLAA